MKVCGFIRSLILTTMKTGFQCYKESPLLTFMSLTFGLRLRRVRMVVICDVSSTGIWLNLNANLIYS